jgi:hypothetical protein
VLSFSAGGGISADAGAAEPSSERHASLRGPQPAIVAPLQARGTPSRLARIVCVLPGQQHRKTEGERVRGRRERKERERVRVHEQEGHGEREKGAREDETERASERE